MTDGSGTPPCFLFHHQYNIDNPNYDTSRFSFTIHCTLEKGAEAYYSGVSVIVIAKNIGYDDNFAEAKIHQITDVWVAGKRVEIEPPEDTNKVIDDHMLFVDGLPLYTLIIELVDLSDGIWSGAEIRFWQAAAESSGPGSSQQIPDTHRVLYKYVKRATVHSPSCVLLLATQYVKPRRLYPNLLERRDYPEQTVLPTHGFRILPPSERRPFFTQPPPEILHHIFSILAHDGGYHDSWRRGLVATSLVCRAWWKAALCFIYEDFWRPSLEKVHIGRLATALKDNPMWGRYIKRISPYCFTTTNTDETQSIRDALTILKTASDTRDLLVGHIDVALVDELIEAFCKMAELRYFTQVSMESMGFYDEDSEGKNYLNAAQLTKCFAHWPEIRRATVYKFGQPLAEDGNELAPAQCALDQITFENGFVSIAHLRAITASSQDTLHSVALNYIKGITNKELTSWLVDFGPNLTSLTLQCNNVFTHIGADELALDATIHKMSKLSHLTIYGPVATVLTLLKFNPSQELQGQIHILGHILGSMLFDLHAFVKALRTTKWETVDVVNGMPDGGPAELIEEAEGVAKQRGIDLRMR